MASYEKISFIPLKDVHFPNLLQWLETEHVKEWWDQDVKYDLAKVENKFKNNIHNFSLSLPNNLSQTAGFIIKVDNVPIGYLQVYPINNKEFLPEEYALNTSIVGCDLIIGDRRYLHKRLGRAIYQAFEDNFLNKNFDYCAVDPNKNNIAAIKMYRNAGFVEVDIHNDHLLMIKKILK